MGLGLPVPTRTDAAQVPVEVRLQDVRQVVARPPCPVGQVKTGDESLDETHRIVRATQSSTASGSSSNCERSSPEMYAISHHTKFARLR